jgi:hypothetical protein
MTGEIVKKLRECFKTAERVEKKGFDYKIPEEWFYILYYCGLAILSVFGVESRSQRYTALFLRYVKEKALIEYDEARYSSSIRIEAVRENYDVTIILCKEALAQAEEIVFSKREYKVPEELLR